MGKWPLGEAAKVPAASQSIVRSCSAARQATVNIGVLLLLFSMFLINSIGTFIAVAFIGIISNKVLALVILRVQVPNS